MDLKEFYKNAGGDYENALQRLSSEKLLLKYVKRFADDESFAGLKNALNEKNAAESFRFAHTLKGMAATLGFGYLATAASALTEKLRGASEVPEDDCFLPLERAYETVIKQIALLEE